VRLGITLGALVLAIALALFARSIRPRPPLPVYGQVPSFHLVDEHGAPFTSESMLGHVSVVDFVFTRCTSSCPRLTARMGELQSRLEGKKSRARLVSFSVDPENDTPPVLSQYSAHAQADPARWSFVTGPPDDVERAVIFGFKVSAARVAKGANDYDVTHGDWFVLVDRRGNLRGYYPMDERDALAVLTDDVVRLEHENP
jgi:protein SCO1/2